MSESSVKKFSCLLWVAFVLLFGFIFAIMSAGFISCSTHIDDLILPEEIPPVDVDVDIDLDFNTLVLGYDSELNKATAGGLGDRATYAWSIDGNSNSPALTPNGATCTLDITKLSVGKHTLLVVGTLDGVEYSADCIITITRE
ncbi:MAG: hypothetical protein K6A43_12305 [Treponema sp.]|nr:hypothetical protein [Treponema sp.]